MLFTTGQASGPLKSTIYLYQRNIFLFVGDRTFYKNFQLLLEAFSIVHQKNQYLHLVCTGKPFSDSELQQISNLKIASNTRQITINDKDMSELYSRALLFVFPSYYEGFGIPILEAYACNCPVALSNATCFPEIAGNAGAFFDPHSITSIANTITEIIGDENKRTKLIQAGQERLKLYSWEKAARETENVYLKHWKNTQSYLLREKHLFNFRRKTISGFILF